MRKENRRFLTLLFLLFLLICLFILIQKLPPLFKKEEKILNKIKKDQIKKIIITEGKEKKIITKNNNRWLIKNFPADQERIEKIIDELVNLTKEEIVSSNKNKYRDFEVEGRRKIEIENHIIYIGKTYSFGKSYFRIDSDPNVYLSSEDLSSFFYPKDFRDLKVYFILDDKKIERIEEYWQGKSLKLTKKEDKWLISNGKTAKREKVDFFINDIVTLKGDDVFEKKNINLSDYQADLLLIVSENGKEKKGTFYQKDQEKYYFYQESSNYIYQIPAAYISSLKKEEKDLIE